MKASTKIRGLLIALVLAGVFASPGAFAQLLLDSTISNLAGSANEIGDVKGAPPASVIMSNLQRQGYTDISGLIPGNPIQATAKAPDGSSVKLAIDPVTGQLVSATPN